MSLRSNSHFFPARLGDDFLAESGRRAVFGADGTPTDGGARSIDSRRFAAIDAASESSERVVAVRPDSAPLGRGVMPYAADGAAAIMLPPAKLPP